MAILLPNEIALFVAGAVFGIVSGYISGIFCSSWSNVSQIKLRFSELQVQSNHILNQETKNRVLEQLYWQAKIEQERLMYTFFIALFILAIVLTILFGVTMQISPNTSTNTNLINLSQNITTVNNYYYQNITYNATNIFKSDSIAGLKYWFSFKRLS